jgi:hypothetical protein
MVGATIVLPIRGNLIKRGTSRGRYVGTVVFVVRLVILL